MVSQELLTPLTSIKGSAAAVLEDLAKLDLAKAGQFFRIIEWQADRMRGLIWDLLEVARIEAGTLFLAPEPTDLAALVGQARAAFVEAGAGNPVEVDLPSGLPRVAADRQRVLQVLDHLLSNASNYSPERSLITVSAWREDLHVAVGVADRGRGIPAQPLPLLFRRLSRREAGDGGRGFEGEALGLAVCRGIVEAHGGRIRAESDGPGLGYRFVFTLPAADEAVLRRAANTNRRPARGQGRVLVVDDDPQALWYINNTLTEAGYTPVVAWDLDAVERLIVMERPHLVLLDLALPGADGPGLMQRILRVTDAPVVFLSGQGREQDLASAFEMGGRGLHRQALLAHRAGGPDRGGAPAAGCAGTGGVPGSLPTGRPGHRLRPAPGDGGRAGGSVDRNGVPFALRAFGERRASAEPGALDEPGLVDAGVSGFQVGAGLREAAAGKAGGDRRQPQVHLQRTQGGLPHGAGPGNRNGTARYCLSRHDPHTLLGSRARLLTPAQPWSPAPWLYRQICRPPSEGRGGKRQNAYWPPRSERLLWRSGASGSLDFSNLDGLYRSVQGDGVPCNAYWVRFGRGRTNLRPGGGKLQDSV